MVDDATIAGIAAERFGIEGELRRLPGERDVNVVLDGRRGRFAVKIANAAERIDALDMQASALAHIGLTDHDLPVPRPIATIDGPYTTVVDIEGHQHGVRAVTYLEGHLAELDDPVTTELAASIGATLARLERALQGFFHPAANRHLLWDARNAADLLPWTEAVADAELRRTVATTIERYAAGTATRMAGLPAQVIHNDLHTANLLVAAPGSAAITGVIDFGDMVHGARAQDVATAVAYCLFGTDDPAAMAARVVASFCSRTRLERAEVEALPSLVAVRLAQSITIGARRAEIHTEKAARILADVAEAGVALDRWLALDPGDVEAALLAAAGHPLPTRSTADVLRSRAAHLHPGLHLSYDEPLHLVRGEGVRLYDAAGRRYLDAYNNVPQVGYGNRRVAAAVANQMAMLNTNTRYLTDAVVDYAERLAALLPEPLDTCLFVNSGTEANDLAIRMARAVTGRRGVVVSERAYHGWTEGVLEVSPEELRPDRMARHVATIPPPRPGEDPTLAARRAIAGLEADGFAPAALMVDTIFSSDGIHDPWPGSLAAVAAVVRAGGGLFIADEVQAGLGRVGTRFWGFAADGVVPDLVTLGKPAGNGFPVGVVVTSHALAEQFAASEYFFSTFGGNPVAAAAATTVLSITLEDELPQRAEAVGHMLRSGIADIVGRVGVAAEIRGAGTFIGVDLGDGAVAKRVVEGMRASMVLVGTTGWRDAVVKIRPPLVFGEDDAAELLVALDDVMSTI